MSIANVKSKWVSGNLVFSEKVTGNDAAIHFGEDDDGLDVKFLVQLQALTCCGMSQQTNL